MTEKPAPDQPLYRIGHGYDVHRFGDGDLITLGGVEIPYQHGFIAHSDGDVLLHALCDAMLGSVAAGDIGQHFPDTDPQYKNIDSRILLTKTNELLQQRGYRLSNIDITIIAQAPKLAPHHQRMIQNLSETLNIDGSQINVKATTTEKLGFAGREEGIAVHAVVMVYKISS